MIPLTVLYDEYIHRPKLIDQKNPFEYIAPTPTKVDRNNYKPVHCELFQLFSAYKTSYITGRKHYINFSTMLTETEKSLKNSKDFQITFL